MQVQESPPHNQARQAVGWHRWIHPLKLEVPGEQAALRRRPLFFAFALMAAGLAVAFLPSHADVAALGTLVSNPGPGRVPTLCFLVGDLCLATGVYAALGAARDRPMERLAVLVLGVVCAALAGQCTRLMWQIVLVRGFYRPSLFLASPQRAAAVGWGLTLTAALTAGFLAPLLVAVANLAPRILTTAIRPLGWLAGRRWWLLLPFGALAATVVVTQWVLPSPLAAAMGYREPDAFGSAVTVSLRALGPAAWSSLQILFALPLLVLMWEGIEAARTCQRLVRKPQEGGETALLTQLQRVDYRAGVAAVIVAVGWFTVTKGVGLTALATVALFVIIALSLAGEFGRAARLAKGFERMVHRWGLPEEWRDLGRISLVLAILVFPVLIVLCANIGLGAKAGLWFPWDLEGFYFYWHTYHLVSIPVVSASGIYGHVEVVIWGTCLGLAGITLVGVILQAFDHAKEGFRAIWFFLRVGIMAFLLASVSRLADHPYATFVLAGGAVIAILITSVLCPKRLPRPTAVWSAVVIGGALSLWSLAQWQTALLPGAVMLGLTILQRFVYNAGNLNDPDTYRPHRVAYFQAVALLSVAVLVLGHGASGGYFESDALSGVSDHVSLSVVAVIWLVLLVVRQTPREGKPQTAKEPPPHWAGLLDPHRELVDFLGRENELTVLLAWCHGDQTPPVQLVTGQGGAGKTRLAVELARRLAAEGWETRWLATGEERAAVHAAQAAPGAVLLVADQAESRAGLRHAMQALAEGPEERVRMLLLARAVGNWIEPAGHDSPTTSSLVRLARQTNLWLAIPVTLAQQDNQIAAHAVSAISREFRLQESRSETRNSKNSPRRRILDLHAAALTATLTDAGLADGGTGTVRMDLRTGPGQLLGHEREFWYEAAQRHGLAGPPGKLTAQALRRIVAACCLHGATTAHQARPLVALVPEVPAELDTGRWLHTLFTAVAGSSGHCPLLPGRLASLHTLSELAAADFAAACLTSLTPHQALRAVTFLAGATFDYSDAGPLLATMLADLPGRVAGLTTPAELLAAVLDVLPCPSATLAPAAEQLTHRLLDNLPPAEPDRRAYWLSHLAIRLAETGDADGALAAEREATGILGGLAATHRDGYMAAHAASLSKLSSRLKTADLPAEALTAAQSVTAHYRELAGADPGPYVPALAASLTELSQRYYEHGQSQLSLDFAMEAADRYDGLVATLPGQYRPGLARALTTLALRHNQRERFADAVPAAERGVALYRDLVVADPARYRPGLAGALENLGVYLSRSGQPQAALPAAEEAVRLYRDLVKIHADQYRDSLAHAQRNLRFRRRELGQGGSQ